MSYFTSSKRSVPRDRSPLDIIRGFYLTQPKKISRILPPLDDEDIKSGMLIVIDSGDFKGEAVAAGWRKAQAADAANGDLTFYVAYHDQDAHDVQASGELVGIPCREDVELKTGYYAAEALEVFEVDQELTAGADGTFTRVTEPGQAILARVSAVGRNSNGTFPGGRTSTSDFIEDATMVQVILGQTGQLAFAHVDPFQDDDGDLFLDEQNNPFL